MPDSVPGAVWAWILSALALFAAFQVYYWVGRVLGQKLYESRVGTKIGRERIDRLEGWVRRWGALAVFGSCWVPVVRHTLPWCAGVVKVSYPFYVIATLLSAYLWSLPYFLAGYAVVLAWLEVAARSPIAAAVLAVAIVGGLVGFIVWRRRKRTADAAEPTEVDAL